MEDTTKVNAKVDSLNANEPDAPWHPLDGFHQVTAVKFTGDHRTDITVDQGYPLKGFVNVTSGEVKFFSAYLFQDDK